MKIYANDNNTSTLKLLIAANLASKKVELKKSAFGDGLFGGPRALPLLEVDDQLIFFSSNAAVQYLFPALDLGDGKCQQLQEWEATRLHPTVQTVIMSKTVPADLKQALTSQLKDVDKLLVNNKYILGDKLSAADVSIWSTLYPVWYHKELNSQYMSETQHIARWFQHIAEGKAIQEAVKQWGGSASGPFGASSALGLPQIATITSPVGSPDEAEPVSGPTAEELEQARDNWLNGLKKLQPPLVPEKVVLPVKGRKNVLITSALPYVNNVPHLGNIIGCVLSADIFARYCRICDYNTLYVCGTDEYGTATETKALEEGLTPRQICDKYFAIHNDVYRWFNIGFDHFGRTTTQEQTEIVQSMFMKLHSNGFISPQSVDQLLCAKCDRFLADRFVEGTCHHPGCLYTNARGDQCDKCGKLINAVELIEPKCKVCGDTPVLRASEQLFIELNQLEPPLRSWVDKSSPGWSGTARAVCRSWLRDGLRPRAVTRDLKWGVRVPLSKYDTKLEPPLRSWVDKSSPGWSGTARAVCRSWLRDGLRPRAVTRDLKWGVRVPLSKYDTKVFYVWFDAPMGYLSITQCATKHYEQWWRPDKDHDVKLYQFMAKDNVPFHAVMFPAALIGVNEGHVLVSHLFATEYLNYEEGKFSKSRGVGVFGTDAQETGIPADVWRFYLASIRPESSDSSFSWAELGTRNNSELLNNLGNFCHRSLSFCYTRLKGAVPEVKPRQADYELMALVNREVIAYVQHMEKGRLRESLKHVMSISKIGNQRMQAEQPWVLLKGSDDDKERGATTIGLCCQLVALLCALLAPYMPETCRRLREQLNVDAKDLRLNPENPSLLQYLPTGHVLNKPEPLFNKIEPERLEELRKKYAGTQSEREAKETSNAKKTPAA